MKLKIYTVQSPDSLSTSLTATPFDSLTPWSEPPWYNSMHSPYYNDSHRALPQGSAPRESMKAWAKSGIPFSDIPVQVDEISRIEGGAMTALGGGSVVGAPPIFNWTTAVKTEDGKYYIVKEHKKWISGAPWATHMTTAVRTGGPDAKGISVLVIPTGLDGFSSHKVPNSGQNAGEASFIELDDMKVPVENLVGKGNEERLIMIVGRNRKASTCLKVSMNYAHKSETFGKKLIEHHIVRHKIATMARYVDSHWAWLEQLAYHTQCSPQKWQTPDFATNIALAKVHDGRLLELANREAQQISRNLRMMVVGGGSEEIIADLAVRQETAMARKRGWKL
ncbi:acyl-CoA dehydrogenase NM domain-like protein [Patellaria atrata CBS 101060]|uniref:Acyl-CoA dehydrogenase NM domain-like protein n=1 Tax=Patellaria atrata CBS 101060 TaxID=1346257 RepID=A0A9P4SEG6_9PEZI|nr:acyl-CoA dehydrogenase NM domain-like protein [Patellaria atrata CBS 101060]